MKKVLIAVVVVVAALVAYNFATTGELKLIPSFSVSPEEQQVRDLAQLFADTKRQFAQAHRSAAVGGIDTTAEADSARRTIKQIERELDALKKKLTSDSAKRRADRLASAVKDFSREFN